MRQAAAKKVQAAQTVEMDLSDVKRRVGQEVGGGELIEPCSCDRHSSLGDGDGLPEPHSLGPRVREGLQVRRHRRAAILSRGDGHRTRRCSRPAWVTSRART